MSKERFRNILHHNLRMLGTKDTFENGKLQVIGGGFDGSHLAEYMVLLSQKTLPNRGIYFSICLYIF